MVEKDYVEVGIGPLRILKPQGERDVEKIKTTARLVMRRESYARGPGTKLLLNIRLKACVTSVIKGEKSIILTVLENQAEEDKGIVSNTYLFRFGLPEEAQTIQDLLHTYITPSS